MNIPVIFALNHAYMRQVQTTLCSLFANAGEQTVYEVYLLHYDLTQKDEKNLYQTFATALQKHSISLVRIPDEDYKRIPLIGRYGKEANFRLFIPSLLPHIKKAIYLDADIIIQSDLTELFAIDLTNKAYAAMSEKNIYHHLKTYLYDTWIIRRMAFFKDQLGYDLLDHKNHYICTGVLVISNEYWQQHNYTQRALDFLLTYKNVSEFPDQDALNFLALQDGSSSRYYFSGEWNFMTYFYKPQEFKSRSLWIKTFFESLDIDADPTTYQPKIIHYAASHPWRDTDIMYSENYVKYASMIGWDIIKEIKQKQARDKLVGLCKKSMKFFVPYGLVKIYAKLKEKI
jgi:lipopolysaccharide biosynthesis glycosyltransferase